VTTGERSETVLVFGASLTGLTAAYRLAQRGYHATIIDHPSWQDGSQSPGSEAASILFGCHHETWRLLEAIDTGAAAKLDMEIPLEFRQPDGHVVAYRSAHLPGALQWMMSLFSLDGLSWHDRWALFSHLEQIWEQARTLPADLDSRVADEWLASIGQSQSARDWVWSPVAQWLTGNALGRLSAAAFVRLLSTIFLGHASDAKLTLLDGTMTGRFLAPLRQSLDRHGIGIKSESRLPELRFGSTGIEGIRVQDGTLLTAQWYIAALAHKHLLALLPERLLTRYAYFAHLSELEMLSEIAVRLTYASTARSPRLLLLAGRPFHQLIITASGSPEITCRLSAIGSPTLMELTDDQLLDLAQRELHVLAPDIAKGNGSSGSVSRDHHAALSLRPGAALLRPIQQGPIENLLVAGAWTDTG